MTSIDQYMHVNKEGCNCPACQLDMVDFRCLVEPDKDNKTTLVRELMVKRLNGLKRCVEDYFSFLLILTVGSVRNQNEVLSQWDDIYKKVDELLQKVVGSELKLETLAEASAMMISVQCLMAECDSSMAGRVLSEVAKGMDPEDVKASADLIIELSKQELKNKNNG